MVHRFTRYIHLFILCVVMLNVQSVFAHDAKNGKDDTKPTVPSSAVLPVATKVRTVAAYRHLVSPESDAEATFVSADAAAEKDKAAGTFTELDKTGRYLEDLLSKDLLQLPIGFKKKVGNGSVEVAVSKVEFYAQYAELTLYVRMKLPNSGAGAGTQEKDKTLFFGAEKVRFTSAGGISSFKAVLLGDVTLSDGGTNGYTVIIKGATGLGQGGEITDPNQTYAQVDCGTFTEAQISAEVLLSTKTVIPLTEGTFEPIEGRVTCLFRAKIKESVDNLVGSLTFKTPFASPSANGFAFKVQNASFDISNGDNPTAMAFPVGYKGDMTPAWQGVYIQNFTVVLPKQFKKKNSSARSTLSAFNVVIDKTGFSGLIVTNTTIFSINEGSASGWAMSLDSIRVGIVQNTLTEGTFAGKLRLPISKNSTFAYAGTIKKSVPSIDPNVVSSSGLDYGLTVSTVNDIDFDLFKAKGTVYKGSKITLAVINDEFKPRADLSGNFTIQANTDGTSSGSSSTIQLGGIEYVHLILQTGSQPICVESLEMKGQGGIANFPITPKVFSLKTACKGGGAGNQADLTMGIGLNLMKDKEGFGGDVTLTFRSEQDTEGNWRYKEIARPIHVGIMADVSAFKLMGGVDLYDEVKGGTRLKGFRGNMELVLKKLDNLTVCAEAEFGSASKGAGVETYYYVGGSVSKFKPIPIGGPLSIDGFSGGIFSHMAPSPNGGLKTICGNGLSYAYNDKVDFGFKAGVNFTSSKPVPKGTIDGYAGFEMIFSTDGGLASLGFYAQAQVLGEIDNIKVDSAVLGTVAKAQSAGEFLGVVDRAKLDKAALEAKMKPKAGTKTAFDAPKPYPLAARLSLVMDFENQCFDGEANVYVNIGFLHGIDDGSTNVADRNLAGRMLIHADKKVWYIHLGTSEKPMGLRVDFPKGVGISEDSYVKASTYLMIGHNIPDYLPPPSDLACKFFGIDQAQYSKRSTIPAGKAVSNDSLVKGQGFAFGANLEAKIKVGGFVYAEGQLGLGFDLLYTNKGNCGVPTAKGRIYAFVKGEIGVAGIPLLGAGVGLFLEGGAPAPMYFTGIAVVEITVIKTFRGKLEIKIGDENECPTVAQVD